MKKLLATLVAVFMLCSLCGIMASADADAFDPDTDQLLFGVGGEGALNPKCYPSDGLSFVDDEGLHITNGSGWVGMDKFHDDDWRTEVASKFATVCISVKFVGGANAGRFELQCGGPGGYLWEKAGIDPSVANEDFVVYSFPKATVDELEYDEDGDIVDDSSCIWAFGAGVWDEDNQQDGASVVIDAIWLTDGEYNPPEEDDPIEDDPIEDDPIEDDPIEDDPIEDDPIEDDPVEDEPIDGPVDPIDGPPTGDAGVASMVAVAVLAAGAIVLAKKRK